MSNPKKDKLQSAIRAMRQQYHDAIAREIQDSAKSYALIGAEFGVSEQTVYQVARIRGLCRTVPQEGADSGQVNFDANALEGGSNE